MKIYKISQDENNRYDTYSDAVVCAENEEDARMTHPDDREEWDGKKEELSDWTSAKNVTVEYIGEAKENLKKGVVCASYHAG